MSVLEVGSDKLVGLRKWDLTKPEERGLRLKEYRSVDVERRTHDGLIRIYEPPQNDRTYTLGFDGAHGIAGRDLSVAMLLDKSCSKEGDATIREVACAAGHWGEERFDLIVYGLIAYYGCNVFVMGESQGGGLAVLRKLARVHGHHWMYYDKSVTSAAEVPAANARLGWNRQADDLTLTEFRDAVRLRKVAFRSAELLDQMRRYKWKARSKSAEKDERVEDDKLVAKLDGGGSPDWIMAAMYAWYGTTQVYLFDKPKPVFAPGSYGDIFGLQKKMPELFPNQQPTGWVSCERG